MTLQVIKPVAITAAILTATDVPETDYPVIANSTAYALEARVISTTTHKVYECIEAYTSAASAIAPNLDPTHWVEVSPTNVWKPFDTSNTSQVSKATSFYYEFEPGVPCSGAAVLNANATEIRWRVTDPVDGLVYDQTFSMIGDIPEADWWSYFFGEVAVKEQQVALDLPAYRNAVYRVDVTSDTFAEAGAIVLGQVATIGIAVQQGATVGIQDYSRTETDDFGETVFVQRAYARRFQINVPIHNVTMDAVYAVLSSLRATPCVWVASGRYAPLTVFGFYKEFEVLIAYAHYSEVTLSIQGLT